MNLTDISDLGKRPIIGSASDAGNEVRDESLFEKLEAELAKLNSASNSASISWSSVNQMSAELLDTKGKDLLVACYLAAGLLETDGLAGLSEGLKVIAEMLEAYWESMFPSIKRIRGRRNALQWLIDRLQQRATEQAWATMPPIESKIYEALQANVSAIDIQFSAKDEDAPSMRLLLSLVRTLTVVEAAPVIAPRQASTTPEQKPASTKVREAPSAVNLESVEAAEQTLDEVCNQLVPIADFLLTADLANPLAYRLGRQAVWTAIQRPPLADSTGSTHLPGPISQVIDALENLNSTESDEDLIRMAEAQLALFPYWLDPSFYCAAALTRMGEAYATAHRELCGECSRFVTRLPGIEKLAFTSGLPFASGETQAWLATIACAPAQASGSSELPSQTNALQACLRKARTIAANGDLQEAVDLLQQQMSTIKEADNALYLQIKLGELLLEQRPGAALGAFALSIVDTIDKHVLEIWNPNLARDGLQIAYQILTRNEESDDTSTRLLQRLIKLDPALAVKLIT